MKLPNREQTVCAPHGLTNFPFFWKRRRHMKGVSTSASRSAPPFIRHDVKINVMPELEAAQ